MRIRKKIKAWQGELLLGTLWLIKVPCKPLGLRKVYRALLIRLIRQTGLFDRSYYLETNSDVELAGTFPLFHYAAYGDQEGRWPMTFFDPAYYRSQVRSRTKYVNALLHYAYVGRYRRFSPSPWFDVKFYLANNKDVFRSGLDPLRHYLEWGGREGRSPCPQFNSYYYLRANPDVAETGVNPLIHYLKYGRFEERRTNPGSGDANGDMAMKMGELPQSLLPWDLSWNDLTPHANVSDATVDVIVPVYKGRAETLRCLYGTLAASCKTRFELIVIDDASPDIQLAEDLKRLAGLGLFTLLVNEQNCGFVHTVNQGMALHPERSVVLLNSDAEVYNDWLDRLDIAANRNEHTGTVTPLSNNATICSYPCFLHDNPYPLELNYEELDMLAASVNDGMEVEAPTAVGFCMYIKRACFTHVGAFDEEAFGKGYGEENDFSQRAINKGWRNVIAADVFVHHWGSASFQGEKVKRVGAALRVINRRYPNYRQDVQRFVQNDPLHEARRRLDWARMKRMVRQQNILLVSHNRGGGSERRLQEEIRQLGEQGQGVFLMRPETGRPSHVMLSHPAVRTLFNYQLQALADTDKLSAALDDLHITEIHIHSLADLSFNAPELIINLASKLGVEVEVNVHDYKAICPRINLIDLNGRYCGEPDETGCDLCLKERGSDFGVSDIRAWRAMRGNLLRKARAVKVPDRDVADRLTRYFPDVVYTVSPHEEIHPKNIRIQHPTNNENLRIVVIGAIGKMKGYDVLRACAQDTKKGKLPLEFILMGYSLDDDLLKKSGVQVTGRYLENEAEKLLRKLSPHVVWLPSLWPETYSYTLSLALNCGIPVFAFDIGAIASRLRALSEVEGIMPLNIASQPQRINELFVQYRKQGMSEK